MNAEEKRQARNLVAKAISAGHMPKASARRCAECGAGATSYHHPDYTEPLNVVPLCKVCHLKAHGRKPRQGACAQRRQNSSRLQFNSERFRIEMARANIRKSDLARATNLSVITIGGIEKTRIGSIDSIGRITHALNQALREGGYREIGPFGLLMESAVMA